MALSLVGVAQKIASINPPDDNSTEAQECATFYVTARDAVLRAKSWPFANQYIALQLVASSPNTDWGFSYRYPNTCLYARKIVLGLRNETTRVPFEIASDDTGKLIYTDQASAILKMTARVSNSDLFAPDVALAMAGRLGMYIAIPLSRSDKDFARAERVYKDAIAEAWANASNEGEQDEQIDAESIRARG